MIEMLPPYLLLDWNDYADDVVVRGHVDLETYRVVLRHEGRDPDEVAEVRHVFARWRPPHRGADPFLEVCQGPARGAGRYTLRARPPRNPVAPTGRAAMARDCW